MVTVKTKGPYPGGGIIVPSNFRCPLTTFLSMPYPAQFPDTIQVSDRYRAIQWPTRF